MELTQEDISMLTKTIIEPFRIKSVEPIRWTTREAARSNFCAPRTTTCFCFPPTMC